MSTWTDERVEVLKTKWAEGHSASQVARMLGGVTRNAVIGKVNRLGLSGRAEPSGPKRLPRTPKAPKPKRSSDTGRAVRVTVLRPEVVVPPPPAVVDAAKAKPWTERVFGECAFPISGQGAGTLSCCHEANDRGYCVAHWRLMTNEAQPSKRDTMRMARWAA